MSRNPNSFDYDEPRRATVAFESWAGRTHSQVMVTGQTLKMFKVTYLDTCLGHRKGQMALVPKYAVRLEDAK